MKKEATLKIAVPDFESIVDVYSKTRDLKLIEGPIIGGQTYDNNYHYNIFDFDKLKTLLEDCGFYDVAKYDWRETEHANIDDYS